MLAGEVEPGATIRIDVRNDELVVDVMTPARHGSRP
jgi:hypothetical protein